MGHKLTDRQQELLDFLRQSHRETGVMPSTREDLDYALSPSPEAEGFFLLVNFPNNVYLHSINIFPGRNRNC